MVLWLQATSFFLAVSYCPLSFLCVSPFPELEAATLPQDLTNVPAQQGAFPPSNNGSGPKKTC